VIAPSSPAKLAVTLATALAVTAAGSVASADEMPAGPGATAAGKRAKLKLLGSPYGKMLFTGRGQALYLFRKDGRNHSNCNGQCAIDWPPLRSARKAIAGRRVRKGLIGSTLRDDGTRQVTYRGHPLYTYAHEGRRQVLCQHLPQRRPLAGGQPQRPRPPSLAVACRDPMARPGRIARPKPPSGRQ
jgi:predicted lipoprotein with Yx(FWY)xxD motif